MGTTVLTLVENTAQGTGLLGEHGMSCWVETDRGAVLFDTGQGLGLLPNAETLEIDLGKADAIVLSHGHFDHTGGLRKVLEQTGAKPVFAHPEALAPKYSVRDGKVREIGIPDARADLEALGASFCLDEGPVEIIPGVTATGRVPRVTDFERPGENFQSGPKDRLAHDMIWDDQSLILETAEGPVVVTGCAHAGIVNTLLYASELAGGKRFTAVVGGTHLVGANEEGLARTIEGLRQFDIGRMAPCHCTGFRGQVGLLNAFGDRFTLNRVGDHLAFA